MSNYLNINRERANNAINAGNMELAAKLFEVCCLMAKAIAAGETVDSMRGKYLIEIANLIADGKEI